MAQYIEADQHGHQPGEGGGDGGSPECPTSGKGPGPKMSRGSSTPLTRPATPSPDWGLGIPVVRMAALPTMGNDQHGDGQIPDEHVIVDEGDELGAGPSRVNRGVMVIAPSPASRPTRMTARNRQSGGDAGSPETWRSCPRA